MKKLFLLCVSALFAAGSYAQTSEEVVVMEVQDVQAVSKYPSVRGFVSNGFWDNWELSFGGAAGRHGVAARRAGADTVGFFDAFHAAKIRLSRGQKQIKPVG